MGLKTKIREGLISLTGYYIFKVKDIPVGCDLMSDLKYKIRLNPNVVFDVGANIGQTFRAFIKNFPEAQVLAFEPIADAFKKLCNNFQKTRNIKAWQVALGEKNEKIETRVFPAEASVMNSLKSQAMNPNASGLVEVVQVIKGDDFCKEKGLTKIDFLKIDTEGFEIEVLKGFQKMIESQMISAIYCEVGFNPSNPRNTYFSEVNSLLYENGYSFYGFYDVSNCQIKTGNNYGNVLYLSSDLVKKYTY